MCEYVPPENPTFNASRTVECVPSQPAMKAAATPVPSPQARHRAPIPLFEADELHRALHLDTQCPEMVNKEALMLVLREYERTRKGAYALPHIAEDDTPFLLACYP